MIFTPTRLGGLWLVEMERHVDERSYFARSWCRREFAEHGLDATLAQASVSFNTKAGMLCGMHFQARPMPKPRALHPRHHLGRPIDLRPGSPTRGQRLGLELSAAENAAALRHDREQARRAPEPTPLR